jgi:hypothetical protein
MDQMAIISCIHNTTTYANTGELREAHYCSISLVFCVYSKEEKKRVGPFSTWPQKKGKGGGNSLKRKYLGFGLKGCV